MLDETHANNKINVPKVKRGSTTIRLSDMIIQKILRKEVDIKAIHCSN